MRGMKGGIRSKANSNYSLTLYELLKSYSNYISKKNFLSINIPKLPVLTTEEGIKQIKNNLDQINDWTNINDLIPNNLCLNINLSKINLRRYY